MFKLLHPLYLFQLYFTVLVKEGCHELKIKNADIAKGLIRIFLIVAGRNRQYLPAALK